MESRSKADGLTSFKTDFEFTLIDQQQYKINNPSFTSKFELIAPAIAQTTCTNLSLTAKTIGIQYCNNRSMQLFGGKFAIKLCSDTSLTITEENLSEAISKSINSLDADRLFNFEPSYLIKLSDSVEDQIALFTWKVSSRAYSYNGRDLISKTKIEFLNENTLKYLAKPHTTNLSYDAWSNLTFINYEYSIYTPPEEDHFIKLESQIREYVTKNKECSAVLKSIINRDFNQALRRACFGGDINLVMMLFKHNEAHELNLNINQASTNGKTPLDYAIASGNDELIRLLSINNAQTKEGLLFSLADTDRKEIMAANQRNRGGSSRTSPYSSQVSMMLEENQRMQNERKLLERQETERRNNEYQIRRFKELEESERRHREYLEREQRRREDLDRIINENRERQQTEHDPMRRTKGVNSTGIHDFAGQQRAGLSLFGRSSSILEPSTSRILGRDFRTTELDSNSRPWRKPF